MSVSEIGEKIGLKKDQYENDGKPSRLEFLLLSMQRYGQSVIKVNNKFVTKSMFKKMDKIAQDKAEISKAVDFYNNADSGVKKIYLRGLVAKEDLDWFSKQPLDELSEKDQKKIIDQLRQK